MLAYILFDVSVFSGKVKGTTVNDLVDLNKVISNLKAEEVSLKFQNLGQSGLKLVVFSDASFSNLPDGGSQGGHFVVLMNSED